MSILSFDSPSTLLRSRRLEPHRVAALPDHPLRANTVGVKHIAPIPSRREEGVEVTGRNGLNDLKGVLVPAGAVTLNQ